MIEKQKTFSVVQVPKTELFDVCNELNRLSFPVSRSDYALFYIRPDMCIRQQDFSAIYDERGRVLTPNIKELIFIPKEEDLWHELTGTVNQLTQSNTAGWWAYTNIMPESSNDILRGNGATPWFALADAWIQVQKWKLQANNQDHGDI